MQYLVILLVAIASGQATPPNLSAPTNQFDHVPFVGIPNLNGIEYEAQYLPVDIQPSNIAKLIQVKPKEFPEAVALALDNTNFAQAIRVNKNGYNTAFVCYDCLIPKLTQALQIQPIKTQKIFEIITSCVRAGNRGAGTVEQYIDLLRPIQVINYTNKACARTACANSGYQIDWVKVLEEIIDGTLNGDLQYAWEKFGITAVLHGDR